MRKTRQQLIRERESEIDKIYQQVREEERSVESAVCEMTYRFGMTEHSARNILNDWEDILARRNALRENS